jgi:hypothetical protein
LISDKYERLEDITMFISDLEYLEFVPNAPISIEGGEFQRSLQIALDRYKGNRALAVGLAIAIGNDPLAETWATAEATRGGSHSQSRSESVTS